MRKRRAKATERALTRREMISVLCYCMDKLWPQLKKRSFLLGCTVDDLANDVCVYIWAAMLRYKYKTYKEALMLGFRTAQNRLASRSRTALKYPRMFVEIDQLFPYLSSNSADPARTVEILETMVRVSDKLVGYKHSSFLIQASCFDWSPRNRRNICHEQILLADIMELKPHQVQQRITLLRKEMEKNLPEAVVTNVKVRGSWIQVQKRG